MKRSAISRRKFLRTLVASGGLIQAEAGDQTFTADLSPKPSAAKPPSATHALQQRDAVTIDRSTLVNRHSPVLRKLDPLSPLSLGNGEFAFTADITGLQTFPREYEKAMPLCTMAQWGWHTSPLPQSLDPKAFRLTRYDTHGRPVGYPTSAEGQSELYNWLRENPHRLHLGQIGLRLMTADRREARAADISDIEQKLDLWTGVLTSRFKSEGKPVMQDCLSHSFCFLPTAY